MGSREREDGNSEGREKEGEKEGEVLKIHKILLLTISSMLTIGGREERRGHAYKTVHLR